MVQWQVYVENSAQDTVKAYVYGLIFAFTMKIHTVHERKLKKLGTSLSWNKVGK